MERDPTDLEGLGQDREEKSKRDDVIRRREIDDLRWIMQSRPGRRFVQRLLSHAGVFRTSFTGNSETFFREGRRDVGLFVLAEVTDNCMDEYVAMLKEAKKDE